MSEANWKRQTIQLSMYSLALAAELRDALLLVAAQHGHRAGPWLDELEAKAIAGIKSMDVEGVDISLEADALGQTISDMQGVFDAVRKSL
jgi:hypothetical protein